MTQSIKMQLIAPCGMNCGICLGYLREKNTCPGCRYIGKVNSDYTCRCIIRKCETLRKNNLKYCSDKCEKYPCRRLKNLDKRYRTRYHMSMIENLENIKKYGIRKFVKNEKQRWACPDCGGTICVHRGYCFDCGKQR